MERFGVGLRGRPRGLLAHGWRVEREAQQQRARERGVEQRPAQHLGIGHGLGDVIDTGERAGCRGLGIRQGSELGIPDPRLRRVEKMQDRAREAADRVL